MSKQLSMFSLLQPKLERRYRPYIIVEENSDEKLKNDVRNCLTRSVDNVAKKVEREEKYKTFQTCKYFPNLQLFVDFYFYRIFFMIFYQRKPIFIQSK